MPNDLNSGAADAVDFYDREGQPISLQRFIELRHDHDYRFLARTKVGEVEIVTAWLGLDQGPFADEDRPLIFGTAAVSDREGLVHADQEEFSATEAEALAAHQRLVERLAGG